MAYKYKIYTPEVWYSFFGGSASLLIKEDGLIYRGDAEYETFQRRLVKSISKLERYMEKIIWII